MELPNYMKPTISSKNKDKSLAKKKEKILKEEAKKAQENQSTSLFAEDGYPKDRGRVVERLETVLWALIELSDGLEEALIINAERSKLKPKKVKKVSMVEASLGAKTDDSAKDLQQWYTIDELAEECMDKFKTHCSDVWENEKVYYVEPSAGEGDILLKFGVK